MSICESILLRSYWVMLVMDLFTRRIVGFGVAPANVDGASVCRMFNHAISGQRLPKYLSSDNDPLFRFYRWLANLRVLEIDEIKSVPGIRVRAFAPKQTLEASGILRLSAYGFNREFTLLFICPT